MEQEDANILIVGGGYTSIELACAIKYTTNIPVTLATRSKSLCSSFNNKAQELIEKYVQEKLGITLLKETTIEDIDSS